MTYLLLSLLAVTTAACIWYEFALASARRDCDKMADLAARAVQAGRTTSSLAAQATAIAKDAKMDLSWPSAPVFSYEQHSVKV